MGDGALRALKIAAIGMAVLIVLGTSGLFVVMMKRGASSSSVPANLAAVLDEPAGTRIIGIAVVQDRLAMQLQGGGVDRVLLVDPRTGAVAGRISLVR
jgi:hypothetical protein